MTRATAVPETVTVQVPFRVVKRGGRKEMHLMEPSAWAYAERHDNIEAIYKKLTERRDTADVTELLKELHRIVNEATATKSAKRRAGGWRQSFTA